MSGTNTIQYTRMQYPYYYMRSINEVTECYFYLYRLYNRFKQYFMIFLQIFETLLRNPSSTEQRVFYTIFAIGQTISSVYPLNLNAGFHVKIYMWSNGWCMVLCLEHDLLHVWSYHFTETHACVTYLKTFRHSYRNFILLVVKRGDSL